MLPGINNKCTSLCNEIEHSMRLINTQSQLYDKDNKTKKKEEKRNHICCSWVSWLPYEACTRFTLSICTVGTVSVAALPGDLRHLCTGALIATSRPLTIVIIGISASDYAHSKNPIKSNRFTHPTNT